MKDMLKIIGNTLQFSALMILAFLAIEVIDVVLSEKNTFEYLFSRRFLVKTSFIVTFASLLVFAFQRGIWVHAKHKFQHKAEAKSSNIPPAATSPKQEL